jgi:hypothetical protein
MMHDYNNIMNRARRERAMALGEALADLLIWVGRGFKRVGAYIAGLFHRFNNQEQFKTIDDVRRYANSIRKSHPAQAAELDAAINREQ